MQTPQTRRRHDVGLRQMLAVAFDRHRADPPQRSHGTLSLLGRAIPFKGRKGFRMEGGSKARV